MRTYLFKAVVEQDDDGSWLAFVPVLKAHGGAASGYSVEEALENLRQVVQMTLESMREHGEAIPAGPKGEIQVFQEPRVAVTV